MNQEPINDFGDVADNNSAFVKIQNLIACCRIKEALEQLRRLQDHIKRSQDIKSQVYLLGRIEVQILALES